ncbi:MAG TPA: cupin domain-containing protein [Solirubrobacteraceae bacterium]|nr:cupin domain-containing protein [Solirubrobacteraceae bacterium]
MGLTHFDEAPARDYALGHLRNRWTLLGEAAGSETIGVRRIQIEPGGWSTPAHEHGASEEIFYVLGGTGVSWQRGRTTAIGPGDCIVYLARRGEHTVCADAPLDLLAFGTRAYDEATRLPRLGISTLGGRAVESTPGPPDGTPIQFVREGQLGPPDLPPEAGPRPRTVVALDDVEPDVVDRPRVARARRELGRAAGAQVSSLNWVRVAPGKLAHPEQCHTLEEKLFVVLSGTGALVSGDDETPVRPGHVIARPAGTGVAHTFRADGAEELTFLAYGNREPGDLCYFPRSGKVAVRGLGVVARLEAVDYWEGED